MVKNRRVQIQSRKQPNSKENSPSKELTERWKYLPAIHFSPFWKLTIGLLVGGVAIYIGIGYLETRVNTPFDREKVVKETGLAVPSRYWGSYRSGHYFGIKSREPYSPVFGLMWYELSGNKGIRHWCDQADNLASYTWLKHDGESFGEQQIVDPPHTIVTSFVKTPGGSKGGHWTARINVTATTATNAPFVLVWYVATDDPPGVAPESRLWLEGGALMGSTLQLNNFKVNLVPYQGKVLHKSFAEAHAPGLHLLKEKFVSLLKAERHPAFGRLPVIGPDIDVENQAKEVNFIPIQLMVETPFLLDIVYTNEELPSPPLKGDEYTTALEMSKRNFDIEFEEKYNLAKKGYTAADIDIAKAALSNMLGGIGYFYGAGRVKSQYTSEPVPYWRAPLYAAVPSRSFFPRGFLWDDGFHGLLIGSWSPEIQLDIAAHWLDLANVEGWIPREQILGVEALARVPKEFVVQSNAAANPPMLLVTLGHLVKTQPKLFEPRSPHRSTLDRMFSRLQAWYQWFQNTQRGEEPTSYRWHGREDDGLQLNPKSLSSGLDDYPRASHPSDIERHVDLRCWMYSAADAMYHIAAVLGRDPSRFDSMRSQLSDEELLNQLHWSTESQTYADYGLHTDGVRLVQKPPKTPGDPPAMVRAVTAPPQPRLVTSAFGYVSLFPMLLKVLSPESAKLGIILEKLDKPDLLWSRYGLRSLSKSAPLYMKRNTEHDPPYWRGQVWVNINYLALAALKHYGNVQGPFRERARHLHEALRDNVVNNILNEYKRTGYLWEQYSGENGKGSGCKPFTGWTALLTLLMADRY